MSRVGAVLTDCAHQIFEDPFEKRETNRLWLGLKPCATRIKQCFPHFRPTGRCS